MNVEKSSLPICKVIVIGAGLAGSDAAYFLAQRNIHVLLFECKRKKLNPAQTIPAFAELVCTNSLKSSDPHSAHGLLKHEMNALGSLVLEVAEETKVPAGHALAVDRQKFAEKITHRLENHPNITIFDEEVIDPVGLVHKYSAVCAIIATGPLTSLELSHWIMKEISSGEKHLYFYDAIAPIVDADSLNYKKLYRKDRYQATTQADGADYLNAPMNRDEYEIFVKALVAAEKVPPKEFEKQQFFESCLPVDLMAERGPETLRFSCMKPVGLELPDGSRPYAVVQLRKENLLGDAYNLVGMQNRLVFGEQKKVFRLIPGLEEANFIHLGSVHRNTYLKSSHVLNGDLSVKNNCQIYFAGQITGVEGYTESAACGLYVAHQIHRRFILNLPPLVWPVQTALGALINFLMTHQNPPPSNVHFGLFPSPPANIFQRPEKSQRPFRKDRRGAKREWIVASAHHALKKTLELADSKLGIQEF